MSHPNPSHDRENEYPSDNYKPVAAKKKAIAKKMSPVDKLKKLLKESADLRKHPFGTRHHLKDDPRQDDNGYDQIAQG